MKVTIKDVAKEANVATSTVSRVLSNSPKISEKTKEKVHEAIKKLNYKPNAIARSLANNKTRILGVVLPEDADNILNILKIVVVFMMRLKLNFKHLLKRMLLFIRILRFVLKLNVKQKQSL